MAILDTTSPIPQKIKLKKLELYLLKSSNEYVYPIEKIILYSNTGGNKQIFYKIIKFNIRYRLNKYNQIKNIKFNLVKNNFSLFSNDFIITYYPKGELITDKDIKKLNPLNILKIKNFNGNLFLNKNFNIINKKKLRLIK